MNITKKSILFIALILAVALLIPHGAKCQFLYPIPFIYPTPCISDGQWYVCDHMYDSGDMYDDGMMDLYAGEQDVVLIYEPYEPEQEGGTTYSLEPVLYPINPYLYRDPFYMPPVVDE